ncbi:MAG: NADH-quinone oxidoreductase subunit K [Elusimicrobiales bacterium]
MPDNIMCLLPVNWFFAALLFVSGICCMLVSRNMLRLVIGVELIAKGCLLAIIASGQALGNMALAQSIAVTAIVVEVVVVAAGLALIVRAYARTGTVDIWKFDKLKG